jgi:hypothetical protein
VDPAFLDLALARLFELPSRIKTEEWKSIASTVGATVRPVEEEPAAEAAAPAPAPTAPASSGGGSLADIMAKLSGAAAKLKEAQEAAAPAAPAAAPKYCPVYDYKKAIALFTDGADSVPGAHRKRLEVAFHEGQAKPQVTYTPIKAADVDAQRESLNGKPIEVLVKELRDNSTNPSTFAPGTDKKNYSSYSVTAVDGDVRTRLYIVIREDTNVSKRIRTVTSTDKLVVRGTAFTTQNAGALTILVDSFDVAGT